MDSRELTSREKVHECYKHAFLFWNQYGAHVYDMMNSYSILGSGKTNGEAWDSAWKYCQKEMIRKLEL